MLPPFSRDKVGFGAAAMGEEGNKAVQETIVLLGQVHGMARTVPNISSKSEVPREGHVWLLFVPSQIPDFQFSWLCAIR